MNKIDDLTCWSGVGLALIGAAFFASSNPAVAQGYGEFEAYLVNMQPNEILSVRKGPSTSDGKLGALPAEAEGIYVIWCNKYDGQTWCDIRWNELSGWIIGDNLQNVEGG